MRLASIVVAALVAATFAPAARAADTVLSSGANLTNPTAVDGQVVLSSLDPATGRWQLVRYANGVLAPLPVAERSVPFDADAGTDAQGRPVVVYSRCTQEPADRPGLAPTPEWSTASGCAVDELPLTGDPVERRLSLPGAPDARTPSIWRGSLAYVTPGARAARIMFLRAGSPAPRRLGGGTVPVCDDGCATTHTGFDQLDLGPHGVAYTWEMTGATVDSSGPAWEIRTAGVDGGRSVLLASGYISGACGFALPSAPSAVSSPIRFLDASSSCGAVTTGFGTADPATGKRTSTVTPGGRAMGVAYDATTTYWLRLLPGAREIAIPGSCAQPTASCELVASTDPPSTPAGTRLIRGPEAFSDPLLSDAGYRWVRVGAVDVLAPPRTVPCAPSLYPAVISVSARWTRGSHLVRASQRDPRLGRRQIFSTKASLSPTAPDTAQITRCAITTTLTYAVSTGGRTQRVSFPVRRGPAPG